MMLSDICATGSCFLPSCITGKERDSESGNDYFGARYYSSAMGRFLSPDWSAVIEPVPYAKLDNPQSLNLYAYVLNNPMTGRDQDGHVCFFGIGNTCVPTQPPPPPRTPDPAHVRPVNDHIVRAAPRTPITVPKRPAASFTAGVGVSGNAEAGVGGAGVEANGSYYKAASLNTNGKAQLGDVLNGGAVAYAGDHVAGAPKQQDTDQLVVAGAYAGVGLSAFIANTPTVNDLSGPFDVRQVNVPLASLQAAKDGNGNWVLSLTIGPGAGLSMFNMTTNTHVDCELGCN